MKQLEEILKVEFAYKTEYCQQTLCWQRGLDSL